MQKKRILIDNLRQQNYFFQRQIKELHSGGISVLFHKCGILLRLPFALLIVLIVRLLRPYILIRFIPLYSSRIGHFSSNTEMYLCKRDIEGRNGCRSWDIFYCVSPICNQQLKKMWKRVLSIFDFAYWCDKINRKLPGGSLHEGFLLPDSYRDIQNIFEITPVHLSFAPIEECLGREALLNMGIPKGAPFICFHARDSMYLVSLSPNTDWKYHDFRDSDIRSYLPAVEALAGRGYFLVRMGSQVKDTLNDVRHPRIIDYAVKHRSEFLDIFLPSKCKFFISSLTGIAEVAEVFRKPIVWVNCIPIEHIHSWDAKDLIITKKLWLRKEERLLTFGEIFNLGIGNFLKSEQYDKAGIDIIDNTPEEILAVAIEMEERLRGTWQTTPEDEELQQRFWSLLKPGKLHGRILSRIGRDFLLQNRDLLE